jgi:hypothetical protein
MSSVGTERASSLCMLVQLRTNDCYPAVADAMCDPYIAALAVLYNEVPGMLQDESMRALSLRLT